METKNQCLLCSTPTDARNSFCCNGCKLVYETLKARNYSGDFTHSNLFYESIKNGLISNDFESDSSKSQHQSTKKILFRCDDFHCYSCVSLLEIILKQIPGVHTTKIDYGKDLVVVAYDPLVITPNVVKMNAHKFGFDLYPFEVRTSKEYKGTAYRYLITFFLWINTMMLSYVGYIEEFGIRISLDETLYFAILFAMSFLTVFFIYYRRIIQAVMSLRYGLFNTDVLIMTSSISCLVYSVWNYYMQTHLFYFDTLMTLLFFRLIGERFEKKIKHNAFVSWIETIGDLPTHIYIKNKKTGVFTKKPIGDVQLGDTVRAVYGQQIGLDLVSTSEGLITTVHMTGEVNPVVVKNGETIFAGSLVACSQIVGSVKSLKNESYLDNLITNVAMNLNKKNSVSLLVDVFTKYFLYAIASMSVLGTTNLLFKGEYNFSPYFNAVFSVMVVACPCMISLIHPLYRVVLSQKLIQLGAVVNNPDSLDCIGSEDCIVFDKTGTLTHGRLKILDGLECLTPNERSIVASICDLSLHPISQAISKQIESNRTTLGSVKEHLGEGMSAEVNGSTWLVGSGLFLEKNNVALVKHDSIQKKVYISKDKVLKTVLVCEDIIDKAANDFVNQTNYLHQVIISGDDWNQVAIVAATMNISVFYAEKSPMAKSQIIDTLSDRYRVMMIGDGLNDTIAMAKVHVSIAVNRANDMTKKLADLVLKEGIHVLLDIQTAALKSRKILYQAVAFAFGYNTFAMLLGAFGYLTPFLATIFMATSSFILLIQIHRISRL
jgi:P-type E1-E2 ATPase